MKATLDGQDLAVDQPSLASAIEAAAARARERGRIVIEIYVDGQQIEGAALDEASQESLEGRRVEMTSTDPASLVRVTLFDAADAMDHAKDEHASCAEMIHRGEVTSAMGALAQLLGTWQAVREAIIQGGQAMGEPLGRFDASNSPEERSEALSKQLEALKRAVADDDLSAVADLLEEDLCTEAGHWADTLRRIAEGMRPEPAS